jgi:1,2-diacylglycerol 3-alpha-glucosyltransferase
MTPPYVLLVCSGLDHAHRGFETFARECFAALREDPAVRIELIKGSGARGPGERSLPTPTRDNPLVRGVASVVGKQAFRLEAFAFGLELVPVLLSRQPDVVYTSEWDTARVLARLRDRTRSRFKVLLSNGGFASTGFEHLDHVQELTPGALEYVLARGANPARHTVLPLGFHIDPELLTAVPEERDALRARLGLPAKRKIVISVAAINRHHKRIDYLIEELAVVPEPRPFLLLVGQPEPETPGILELARSRLGAGNYDFRTVPAREIPELLRSSDLFVLASLEETQGRALIESAAAGVECIAYDNPVMRFALGEHGIYGDLGREGELARLFSAHANGEFGPAPKRRLAAHRHVYERFSWHRLRPRYVELLTTLAGNDPGAQRARVTSAHSEPTTRAAYPRRAIRTIRRHSSGSNDSGT